MIRIIEINFFVDIQEAKILKENLKLLMIMVLNFVIII
jgi:hypothetical protein